MDHLFQDYKKFHSPSQNTTIAFYNQGILYEQQGKLNLALLNYQRAIKLDQSFIFAYIQKGNILQILEKNDLAQDCYEQVIRINKEFPGAYLNLGILFKKLKNINKTIEIYQMALQFCPNADIYYNYALALTENGEVENAKIAYQQVIKLQPNYFQAYNNMGNLLLLDQNVKEALKCYQMAIVKNPSYIEAHVNLGAIQLQMGKPKDAVRSFSKAIMLNNSLIEQLNDQSILLDQQGLHVTARNFGQKAFEKNPDLAQLYYQKGCALIHVSQLDEIQQYDQKLLDLKLNEKELLHEALKQFDTAILLDPCNSNAIQQKEFVINQLN